jgi:hypothetical protein
VFDAKKLLDAMMAASQAPAQGGQAAAGGGIGDILGNVLRQMPQQPGQAGQAGGLGDLLGGVLGQLGQPGAAGARPGQAGMQPGAGAGGGLGDLLGGVLGQLGQPDAPAAHPGQAGAQPGAGGAAGGGLGDLLGGVLAQIQQGQGTTSANAAGGAGGLGGLLGSLLGGAGGAAGGQGDLVGKLKDLVGQNQLASGAAMGGLAAIFLGSKAGRGLAVNAAKLGGLAMIGGLAYQAWQNYSQGQQAQASATGTVEEAPADSPFGLTADTANDNSTAILLIRAMIAAAAADGVVDDAERAVIVGNLRQIGLDPAAAGFLDEAFANPYTPDDLANDTSSPEVAAQVYTAARLTIDPNKASERAFLAQLASGLGLDDALVAHIDAAAESVKALA